MAAQSFIAPPSALDRRTLGKFEVLCRLSTGGMSEIYLAHQRGLGGFRKLVVLKTILPDIGGDEDFVRMFLEEARTTAAFAHPNIAQVYELDVDEGQLFMAMEFVQGCTLVEMARACRQAKEAIPIGFTLAAVRDTALALHYAHTFIDARGRKQVVIHRDVAEKNIMVTFEGVTKLLDFGIAKAQGRGNHTSVGMVKGTSGYMSPEQIRGETLDARSDLFSLGVVAHECLTGMRLFHGKTAEEGMLAALNQQVHPPSKLNPSIWPELDAVVLKALQRSRDDRFGTALEFARALEKASKNEMWLAEQSGAVVSRYFADRRLETSRLLESFFGDTTGELRIDSLLARVRGTTPAGAAKVDKLNRQNPVTSPARPRSLPPTPPVPPPRPMPTAETSPVPLSPARSPPASTPEYDSSPDAKTIPASSMSEELKLLRAKFKSQRESAPTGPEAKGEGERPPPPVPSAPNIVVEENVTHDMPLKSMKKLSSDGSVVVGEAKPSGPRHDGGRKPDLSTFAEDDDEGETVMANQADIRRRVGPSRMSDRANSEFHRELSGSQPTMPRKKPSNALLVAMLVTALIALTGLSAMLWIKLTSGMP